MKASLTLSRGLLLAYVLLTLACLGTAIVTELAELRSSADVNTYLSPADLAAWQMATTDHTALLLTVLAVGQTAALLALVWLLPASVPRGVLWAALGCHAAVWLFSLLAYLPLGAAGSSDLGLLNLLNLLVHSDWVRKLVLLIEAPLALYMAYRAFVPPTGAARPAAPTDRTPALG